ncbi:hypothetical protein AZE42_13391 [Rhizopogon vesiculosus]|uniref:Uncharacterized protein n=1 Tax=Rhizopogon vesiculosus TaxID=180088 RepID=A0A1J8PW13_9AGAM|nr:hypothetical protein AZE42_13391 [Rhizopogon vesiculosus]
MGRSLLLAGSTSR